MHKTVSLWALLVLCLFLASCDGAQFKKKTRDCNIGPSRAELIEALPKVECVECELAVDATRFFIGRNATEHSITDIIIFFCKFLKIEDAYVCYDVIHEFEDFFFYALTNEVLSPTLICGILDMCDKPVYPTWNVTFPTPQPPVKPYPSVNPSGPRVYMLHITDLHVDPEYTPGLQTNCGEPLCCRPPNPKGTPGNSAGQWGDYACDAPPWLYENMLQWIAKNLPEINYGIFTGDMPPHDVWAETRNSSLSVDTYEMSLFKKILPNVKLFPAVGNHEGVPVNEFATRDIKGQFDMSWLYTPLSQMWSSWLPAAAVQQAQFAGYYTALTPDGVRIISMNTNLGCNSQNWWLTLPSPESADPDNQLHWLAQVLHDAELANEVVYLIYHIAPGLDCTPPWWNNYFKIVERYQNIILGCFAGHTHADVVQTTYTKLTNSTGFRPMLTTYFPGSLTPYTPENPGFRVYEIDVKTKAVVDYREFAANLTLANIVGYPTWYLEYSAKRDYQMADLSPSGWRSMAMRAQNNQPMLQAYAARRGKGEQDGPCNTQCLYDAWCDMWVGPPGYHVICGE